jgi:cell division protein FtsL
MSRFSTIQKVFLAVILAPVLVVAAYVGLFFA